MFLCLLLIRTGFLQPTHTVHLIVLIWRPFAMGRCLLYECILCTHCIQSTFTCVVFILSFEFSCTNSNVTTFCTSFTLQGEQHNTQTKMQNFCWNWKCQTTCVLYSLCKEMYYMLWDVYNGHVCSILNINECCAMNQLHVHCSLFSVQAIHRSILI